MKKILLLLLLGFNCLIYAQEFTDLYGDYLGQTPPGDKAVIFAPGIISLTDRWEAKIAFSPDGNELYFQTYGPAPDYVGQIYYTKRVNNTWTEPMEAPFSLNHNVGAPFFSADGNWLYFYINDGTDYDIYKVERTSAGWSEPQRLPLPINSNSYETSYTETVDGVMYIDSRRSGGNGEDIWCIRRLPDQSLQVENLGATVNSTDWDFSPCIAPDGSYLIFGSDRDGRPGAAHLYISFNNGNDGWTTPVDMNRCGAQINNNNYHQSGPSLSPDGKFLFFFRHYNDITMDVYWVRTSVINDIKKTVLPDPNGLIENTSTGQRFSSIQCAINYAKLNETIVMEPSIYEESITIDKDIILQSVDPNDPFYIGGTIIRGDPNEPVVTLSNNTAACTLAGLTLRVGSIGISGTATQATIHNCRIMDNLTHGVELIQESNPHLLHCLVTANGETGINMKADPGRLPKICKPMFEDCVIVHNGQGSLVGGEPVLVDSIEE